MSSYSGALKIIRFNWPWYAVAVAVTITAVAGLFLDIFPGISGALAVAALVIGDLWLILSLAVSHYVYDRSPIARGAWLDKIVASQIRRAAIFHAGQDEASPAVARLCPSIDFQVFDFYDERRNGTESLKRARSLNPHRDVAIRFDNIPLDESSLDLVLVVFAAHEIRDDRERTAFFGEVRRVLAPTGRAIVVEHLRDIWNFAAYGPGAFHFFSERTWHRSFANGELEVVRESACTPFVRVFELGKDK